jgi:S-adenosylmethionine:tRNA ribosyltransferase-isomerase
MLSTHASEPLRTADFDYQLPVRAIAQHPVPRGQSRLYDLRHNRSHPHRYVGELDRILRPGDLLVVNDTQVLPARLRARRPSGGAVEVLLVRELETAPTGGEWEALLRPGRRCRPGDELVFDDSLRATIAGRRGDAYRLRFSQPPGPRLDQLGEVPLPPYIRRPVEPEDRERYQTLFARHPGAVAAPTAGLHFDEALLRRLEERGVGRASVTLHVGPGTFRPVTVDDPRRHRLEPERFALPPETAAAIAETRRAGRRVVAVGTTVVRVLEGVAATSSGRVAADLGEIDLFIAPPFRFRVVDLLLTNFHLPRSTLLMLVCAFGGRERVLAAYRDAVEAGYRFYSYGDVTLLDRAPEAPPVR